VKFALRAHICWLAPASNVNWLPDSSRLVSVMSTYPRPAIAGIQQVAREIGLTRKYLIVTGALLVS
jgi:hypothetical protein